MTKTNLAITEHEDKTSKNGKDYTRFKTNQGWMSCFETDVIKTLKENEGKIISVEVAESEQNGKSYKNIRGFNEVVAGAEMPANDVKTPEVEVIKPDLLGKTETNDNKGTSYYTSYAKDIFIALYEKTNTNQIATEELMQIAIDVVKQGRQAFS